MDALLETVATGTRAHADMAVRLLVDLPGLRLRADRVLRMLQSSDDAVVSRALQLVPALGRDGPPHVPILVRYLETADERVAVAAADALGRLGKAALPDLMRLAGSGNARLRLLAIRALGKAGWPARHSFDLLRRFHHEGAEEERQAAETALASLVP